jgi:hypothetical protein
MIPRSDRPGTIRAADQAFSPTGVAVVVRAHIPKRADDPSRPRDCPLL